MRISRTKSISLPPEQLRRVERLAKRENRTISELVREALRHYEQRQQAPAINYDLIAALRAIQQSAKAAGLDKMTEEEIDAEVQAVRRQRDKKIQQPTR